MDFPGSSTEGQQPCRSQDDCSAVCQRHPEYSNDYLATHTLAGGNAAKEPLDPEVVRAVTGKLLRLE